MAANLPRSPKYKQAQAYYRGVLANERRIRCLEAEIERQQSRLASRSTVPWRVTP